MKGWAASTIVISQILRRLLEALFINLEATALSEALGKGGGGIQMPVQISSHPPVGQKNSKKSSAPYVQKYLFTYLLIYLFVYLFIYFNIYLSIYLFIYSFIYLFIYKFANGRYHRQ